MSPPVKPRTYDGSNRARQAEETRRRIVDAAASLFEREGYAATSIAAIAQQAGVAVPTVYASVGSKPEVLRAVVDLTVRGDADTVPLAERPEWQAMEEAPDPRERLALFAALHRGICEREAGLFAQLDAAAGGDAGATRLLAEQEHRRYTTQFRLAETLAQRGELRAGMSADTAGDIVWTIASERTYLALVRDRGWSADDYERWLAETLATTLLAE